MSVNHIVIISINDTTTDTVDNACRVKASKDQKLIYCYTEDLARRQARWEASEERLTAEK
jgi:hypothetical protein